MADPNIEGKQLPFGGKVKYDYIMWIDSDSVFRPPDFKALLDRMEKDKNLHILSALYLGVNGKYTAGQVIKNKEKDILESKFLTSQDLTGKSELIKVDFVGMGFMMVRYGVFEALEYPWFYPLVVGANGQVTGFTTEDVSFCIRAQAKGYSVYIDPKVKIRHEKLMVLK
jgi:GT2 family glycosyltransferase